MAERRMMTRKITDDDNFINLSSSAQALYLHLSMSADDDGFCNQVSTCMFRAHASTQDLQALLDSRYLLQFENGVMVIKHWRMANAIRKDRYTPTAFQEEFARLGIKDNGAYTLSNVVVAERLPKNTERLPSGCQVVANCLPQDRIGKDSIDKDRVGKNKKTAKFVPPTLDEVTDYCIQRKSSVNPKEFFEYFNEGHWIDSNGKPVRNWKQKILTWEKFDNPKSNKSSLNNNQKFDPTEYLLNQIREEENNDGTPGSEKVDSSVDCDLSELFS